jgi:hypothetical protein
MHSFALKNATVFQRPMMRKVSILANEEMRKKCT